MGQTFLKHSYYKMHFYLKCVILTISLNYFHVQQKKIPMLKKKKENSLSRENVQNSMVLNRKRFELGVLGFSSIH